MNEEPKDNPRTRHFRNWLTYAGGVVALGSFFAFLLLFSMDMFARTGNPYMGILAYVIAPAFLFLGLGMVALGVWVQRRQERRLGIAVHSLRSRLSVDLTRPGDRKKLRIFVVGALVFLLFTAIGSYQTYHVSESVQFCGQACHVPMKPEFTAYQFSAHARVSCVECHVGHGPEAFVKAKMNGVHQLVGVMTGKYGRPIPTPIHNLRPARETCEQCHWPQKFSGNIDRTYPHFLADATNSAYAVRLSLNVGGADPTHGPVGGIHWHVSQDNKIEYLATDERRQVIPWVRVTDPKGVVTEYRMPKFTNDISTFEIRQMDCMDCHNRPSHRFRAPNDSVDFAMSIGRIDPKLPWVKSNSVAALMPKYATEAEALAGISSRLRATYGSAAGVDDLVKEVQTIYTQNFFPEMKADWRAYPENIGHKDWPGCFRCHDGKHSAVGSNKQIPASDCTSCHTIIAQGNAQELLLVSPAGQKFKHPGDEVDEPAMIVIREGFRVMGNIRHSTFNFQRPSNAWRSGLRRRIGCWGLDVRCWMFLLLLPFGTPCANAAEKFANTDCLDCHTDPTNQRKVDGKDAPLALFPTNAFAKSVHGQLDCIDCHEGIKDLVHESKLPPPVCAGCHEKEGKDYATSIHGVSHKLGASGAADCWSCHGAHEIAPVKQADSPVFKLNLPNTCATCHTNASLNKEYQMKYPEAAAQYKDSIHGRALLKMGLIIAPSCNDCHGVHDIKRGVDREAPINHANVAKTCGKCHVGIEQIYEKSVHGQLLAKGDKRGPVCTDCHTAHGIETPQNGHFKMASDQRCGKCHQDRLEHYRDTYHGKAMALGKPMVASQVAACFDCHGHHDVLPPSNPESRLSKDKILGTCQQCHPTATAGFTGYRPHANPLDRENYPLLNLVFLGMTGLLIGVFSFFGLHTIVWLARVIYISLHDTKSYREARAKTETDTEWFTRFVPFERFLHFLVVTSFLLLVITGMPLKFYYTNWAKVLFSFIGGVETARTLHHFGAVVTFLYFGLHLASLIGKSWKGRGNLRDPATGKLQLKRLWGVLFGPDSMMPTWQDWKDFVAHNKWFFGKGPKPTFDRWTYWEKFDYFAVFWGVAIIGSSGLILWYPAFFTRFLPGWTINIAHIIHSDEALLAAGFIFSIHFFNTHFRIEKFPMDTVIFSGRVSKTELMHERKRWYDRLVATGKLDQHRVKDEWIQWKTIARSFGYLFFGVGVVLLLLIIYAMVSRLAH